jgi:hypothetical protein
MKATYVKSGSNYLPAINKNRMISVLYGDPLATISDAKKYAQIEINMINKILQRKPA